MLDWLSHIGVRGEARRRSDQRALAAMALFAILAAVTPAATQASDCPRAREPRIPPSEEPAINIEKHKKQLLAYQAGDYNDDIKLVLADARRYFEQRADQIRKPAIVLDIDETSLSNWQNIKANNFVFIKGGPCSEEQSRMRLRRVDSCHHVARCISRICDEGGVSKASEWM